MTWTEPKQGLLILVASLLVHVDEYLQTGHEFDKDAIAAIMVNPGVKEWLDSVPDVLKPVKR